MFNKIHLDAPSVGDLEKEYLSEAIDSGFISSVGPFIGEFEQKIAQYLGVQGAVAVQSGTAAIYLALYELNIGPQDEVIVPALTFAATVNPVLYTGATPVIVDVDHNTWNIDPVLIRRAITNKTKAILPVHLYGNPCDMTAILSIAKEYGLFVIEDATESLGSTLNGKNTGVFGDFGCFSFNGNKLITTGGGGMIVSNHVEKIEHIRYLVNQAKDKDRAGFHSEMGFNFRMTNIEAALGLAQFKQMNQFLEKRKTFKDIYQEVLIGTPNLHFQAIYNEAVPNYWLTCINLKGKNSDLIMTELGKKHIPTRRLFLPINQLPYLQKYSAPCPKASFIYEGGLCLPSSSLNEEKDIQAAALVIKEVLNG